MTAEAHSNGKLGLAQVILTGCQGISKGLLPDDVLKVRVHGGMRARSGANEKSRRYLVAGFRGCKEVVCGPAHT